MAQDDQENIVRHIDVEICTPERAPLTFEASEIMLPGEQGVLAVLPGHTPLLTTLTRGTLIAYGENQDPRFYAINGGFAEILNNRVLVLTHTIEHATDIDRERAEAARERAEARLQKREEQTDLTRAEAALERALARIQAHSGTEYS